MAGRLFDQYFRKQIRQERDRRVSRFRTPVIAEADNAMLKSYEAVWQETMSWLLQKRDSLYNLDRNAPSRLQVDSLIGSLEKAKATPDDEPETIKSNLEGVIADYESMTAAEAPGEIKDFLTRTTEALRDTLFSIGSEPESFSGGGGAGGPGPEGEEAPEGGENEEDEETEPSELEQIAGEIFPNEEPEGEEEQ